MAKQPLHTPLSEFDPPDGLTEEEFLAVYSNEVDEATAGTGAEEGSKILLAAAAVGNVKLCRRACEDWGHTALDMLHTTQDGNDDCMSYLHARMADELQRNRGPF